MGNNLFVVVYIFEIAGEYKSGLWGIYDSFKKAKKAMFEAAKDDKNEFAPLDRFYIYRMRTNDVLRQMVWTNTTIEEFLTIPEEELEEKKECKHTFF